jgi:hypothetical protein
MAGDTDYIQRQDAVLHMKYKHQFFFKNKLEKKRVSPVKKNSKRVKHTTHSHKEKGCRKKLGLERKPATEAEKKKQCIICGK